MNLLEAPWIPVRADHGAGAFQLLTYRALLCEAGQRWQISLPRDDLELACLQLLVCMTQVMFLPEDDPALRRRLAQPLTPAEFHASRIRCRHCAVRRLVRSRPSHAALHADAGCKGCRGHTDSEAAYRPAGRQQPRVLQRGGRSHSAQRTGCGDCPVQSGQQPIALFNQASNCPSFGGGFKGSLRGGAPIATLVFDEDLRCMVWRNVLTRPRVAERQIDAPGPALDHPTWVSPIAEKSTIHWNQIGLMRGLFWQPAHVELLKSEQARPCDVLGGEATAGYSGFLKEKFNFTIEGVWPHPHGAMNMTLKKGVLEQRFASFTTTAPAWTQLSEFVIPRGVNDKDAKEGSTPAGPISQFHHTTIDEKLNLLVGGYRTNQARWRLPHESSFSARTSTRIDRACTGMGRGKAFIHARRNREGRQESPARQALLRRTGQQGQGTERLGCGSTRNRRNSTRNRRKALLRPHRKPHSPDFFQRRDVQGVGRSTTGLCAENRRSLPRHF